MSKGQSFHDDVHYVMRIMWETNEFMHNKIDQK